MSTTMRELETVPWVTYCQLAIDNWATHSENPYEGCAYSYKTAEQGAVSPLLDGPCSVVSIDSPKAFDVLATCCLIGQGSLFGIPDAAESILPQLHNFNYTKQYLFTTADEPNIDAIESDIAMFIGAISMTIGTQTILANGEFDIWDNVHAEWIDTGIRLSPKPGQWNDFSLTASRDANNNITYEAIGLNGKSYPINATYPAATIESQAGWYGLHINCQLDGKGGTPKVYLRDVALEYS